MNYSISAMDSIAHKCLNVSCKLGSDKDHEIISMCDVCHTMAHVDCINKWYNTTKIGRIFAPSRLRSKCFNCITPIKQEFLSPFKDLDELESVRELIESDKEHSYFRCGSCYCIKQTTEKSRTKTIVCDECIGAEQICPNCSFVANKGITYKCNCISCHKYICKMCPTSVDDMQSLKKHVVEFHFCEKDKYTYLEYMYRLLSKISDLSQVPVYLQTPDMIRTAVKSNPNNILYVNEIDPVLMENENYEYKCWVCNHEFANIYKFGIHMYHHHTHQELHALVMKKKLCLNQIQKKFWTRELLDSVLDCDIRNMIYVHDIDLYLKLKNPLADPKSEIYILEKAIIQMYMQCLRYPDYAKMYLSSTDTFDFIKNDDLMRDIVCQNIQTTRIRSFYMSSLYNMNIREKPVELDFIKMLEEEPTSDAIPERPFGAKINIYFMIKSHEESFEFNETPESAVEILKKDIRCVKMMMTICNLMYSITIR